MWNTRWLLVSVSLCTVLATAAPPQRAVKTFAPMVSSQKIDNFLKAVQDGKTLKGIQTAFEQAGFTPRELDSLKKRIADAPALAKKIAGFQADARGAVLNAITQTDRGAPGHLASLKLVTHNNQIKAVKQKLESITHGAVANPMDPEVRCRADAPSIREVSQVTPGAGFAIQGMGLGAAGGSVDVMTGGRTFAAQVISWNSCQVVAQLGDDVDGVRANSQAMVVLRTGAGKEIRAAASFEPVIDVQYDFSDKLGCDGDYCCGCSEDWTVFRYQLKNDWYVANTELTDCIMTCGTGSSHGEITSAPATNVPNGWATTVTHAGASGCDGYHFRVRQTLKGPKGLSPH